MHEAGPANAEKYNHAVWMLALGNAVPLPIKKARRIIAQLRGTLNAGKFISARDKANNAYIDGISGNDWLASILHLVRTQAES